MIEDMLASEFYKKNVGTRKPFETVAEDISAISIPYLVRQDGSSSSTPTRKSVSQSYNGRCINTLKSKMGMALLPPSTSSFRLDPNAEALESLVSGDDNMRAEVGTLLSSATSRINKEIENQQIRDDLFNVVAQLIVAGSCIVEKKEKKGIVIHPLKNIVVELDEQGEADVMSFVETIKFLPDGVTVKEEKDEYEIYTMVYRDAENPDNWIMRQDIDGETVGDEVTYNNDNLPFQYMGWTYQVGDDYHRPYAEDYYADMEQIDKLSEGLTNGSIISMKSVIMVNQRGNRTRKKDLVNAANGAVIDGSAEDVTAFQLNKNHDFQVTQEREAQIKKELAHAFLLNESSTRNAERVTAEEIRYMAQELETSGLSGIYSKLSVKWSKWLILQIMRELSIKFDTIEVNVITGLDALGRNAEAQKLDGGLQRLQALELLGWMKEAELVSRILNQQGIDTTNLVKTPDEMTAERQAQAQQAQQAMIAESAANSTGKMMENAQQNEAAQQQQQG